MKTLKYSLVVLLWMYGTSVQSQQAFKVDVQGKGKPVLLLPGFTCTAAVWEETVAELSKNYECHSFTLAGFGDVPTIGKPWLPKIKEAIVDYVKEKQLNKPTIIGHSLGGTLGLWLASEEKEMFGKIIVVDALPSTGALMIPNFNSEDMVYDSPYNQQLLQMNDSVFKTRAVQMAGFMSLNKEKHEQLTQWILEADRETYVYGYTDLLRLDLREAIANITSPVAVIAATHPYGLAMAQKTYSDQYQNLKTYDILYAEGSAHFIMYDKSQWFLEQLKLQLK
ncbi:alpha/beta fold hydrolase [Spongiimicrobium salis]|uniref:alpha/beta fold hydrolase n=1 Tax=Spongiimicrobium salis TaxID=1667022 RepID=UPI00374D852B